MRASQGCGQGAEGLAAGEGQLWGEWVVVGDENEGLVHGLLPEALPCLLLEAL